ncbi:MAG: hemolysin family protein [Parvibaculaceae bacterium]|nr:hemolysin family protein [Parvibaculaceae bacterium]
MLADVIILLVLIALNGFFSLAEMAIVSSRRQRLQAAQSQRAENGRPTAGYETAIMLSADPGRFLSAQQIGITLIGVLSGAFGGATLADPLRNLIAPLPYIGPYAEPMALALVVVVITYLSIVMGELVPKRIALSNPEGIAAIIARPMASLTRIFGPAVSFLSISQDAVLRLAGLSGSHHQHVTEEEIRHLVEEGAASGVIEGVERDIVNRVFRLDDTRVTEIMTPRIQMVWLDLEASFDDNIRVIRAHENLRYPVRRGGESEPIGMIRVEDLFFGADQTTSAELFRRMSPPTYIPRTASVLRALSILQHDNKYMGFVIDEYGDVVGTLSQAEIFQAMVGDVTQGYDDENSAISLRDDGSYLIDGLVPVEDVRKLLKLNRLPGDESAEVNTLAGVMFDWFGRLPREGDYFAWNGYRFEIADMDGPRIDKVLVVPAQNLPIGKALLRAGE